jgi:Antibiotic biosynthesis monooxygenase
MALVSVTRLRVRSLRYILQFMWEATSSARQAEHSPGFLGGRLLRNPGNVFWTITAWEDAAAMNAYRTAGAHRRAMPKLLIWCNEATVVHWNQESSGVPSWQEAHQHMLKEGKPSKVNYPSPAHVANDIPAPKPSRIEQTLKPSVPR